MGNEASTAVNGRKRPRGRPRLDVDLDTVADVVAQLFAEGGEDAVTIPNAAELLGVSRATLYRTVPTREYLMGILFERSTQELTGAALEIIDSVDDPAAQLEELVVLLTKSAMHMHRYMPVFFGGGDLPADVVARWHAFAQNFENIWVHVVRNAMRKGGLEESDPVITARLILGQCIWVSRWYRPNGPYDESMIADAAVKLLPTRHRHTR